jgi:hypothetical protein
MKTMFFDSEDVLREKYLTRDERDLLQMIHKPAY